MDATELAKSTVAAATVRWVLVMRTAPFQATSTPLEPFEGATVTHPVLRKRKLGAQSLSAGRRERAGTGAGPLEVQLHSPASGSLGSAVLTRSCFLKGEESDRHFSSPASERLLSPRVRRREGRPAQPDACARSRAANTAFPNAGRCFLPSCAHGDRKVTLEVNQA